MAELYYQEKALIKSYFRRTGDGVLPEHIIMYLSTHSDRETIIQDAQRYLSDLYFEAQNKNHNL